MLATTQDLDDLLGESVPLATATLLIELATAAVQEAAGQRLVAVAADVADLMGTTERWLKLPERPVTDVTSVTIDGEAVTDFKRFGARLWREKCWSDAAYEPSEVQVTYDHGWAADDQSLGLARSITLMLAAQSYADPDGSSGGMSIDDYQEQRSRTSESLLNHIPVRIQRSLRRAYGGGGGLVRVG